MNSHSITNLPIPTLPHEAANKLYVDSNSRKILQGYVPPLRSMGGRNNIKLGFIATASSQLNNNYCYYTGRRATGGEWVSNNETRNFWIQVECPDLVRIWGEERPTRKEFADGSWKRAQMEKFFWRCLVRRIRRILEMKSKNLKLTLFTSITATGYCVLKHNPQTLGCLYFLDLQWLSFFSTINWRVTVSAVTWIIHVLKSDGFK